MSYGKEYAKSLARGARSTDPVAYAAAAYVSVPSATPAGWEACGLARWTGSGPLDPQLRAERSREGMRMDRWRAGCEYPTGPYP